MEEENEGKKEKIEEGVKEKLAESPKQFCVICEEKFVEVALLPCGHLSFCSKCAEPLKQCPICRKDVTQTARIYQNA